MQSMSFRASKLSASRVAAPRSVRVMAATKKYETIIVLRPDLADDERDRQLAKLEAFLGTEGAASIDCSVKGRTRMAYPINGHWEGIFVLFQYAAQGKTVQAVQNLLANPDAESQGNLLRWQTFAQQ